MWQGKSLAVILPTFNEAASIAECINAFHGLGIVDDIIVVNNNAHPDTSSAVSGTTAREVFERPAHPYTQALVAAIPDPQAPGRRPHLALRDGEAAAAAGCAFAARCPRAEARCRAETPALRELGAGRRAACHFA